MQSLTPLGIPAVTIVLPVYNRRATVARALDSIRGQSFSDYEVIIVDDGSTDGSDKIIAPYLQDWRFRYFKQANSGKPSRARNAGVKLARCEWLAFLDSDDEWPPDQLASQMQTLLAFRTYNVGMVFTDNRKVINGQELHQGFFTRLGIEQGLKDATERLCNWGRLFNPQRFQRLLCYSGFVMTQGVLVNRHLWQQVGGFDTDLTFAEDTDCWLKISGQCRVAQAFGPGFRYHCHGQNMTADTSQQLYQDSIRVLQRHEQLLADDIESVQHLRARILVYQILLQAMQRDHATATDDRLTLRHFTNLKWNRQLLRVLVRNLNWLPFHLALR